MAYTYLILNIVFIVIVSVLLRRWLVKPSKVWWLTLLVMLFMTFIFDNILVGVGLYQYGLDKILNWYVFYMPVEDFFYTILAVILIPALWNLFNRKEKNTRAENT